jgi:hypothetical protein
MRTVFENDKNERWFIEITTGVVGETFEWIIISHLFRIDIEEDFHNNYTRSASEIIDAYYKEHNEYNEKNIIKLFERLGLKSVELKYCDFNEYNTNNYEIGNIKTNYKQLSLF